MGVEILWMMPIHPIGIKNRKGELGSYYSISDFREVNPEFGTKADFKQLIEAVHDLGMKIILDWVANHAAWDNVWTLTNPEFFVRDETGNFKPPYDWDDVIQIDHTCEAEQQAMQDAMKYWVSEFDIDGFRADLAHLTPLPFWVHARKVLDKIKPGLIWLAETEDIPYLQAFDIVFAWKWMHATENYFKHNHHVASLINLLVSQQENLPANAMEMFFTSNHDENSWNGTEYEKYGRYAKALAVFNYTWPNAIPLIYSGQELPNKKRLKFFDKDVIEWKDEMDLHAFYKTLASFHRNLFEGGEISFLTTETNVLAFARTIQEKGILVFMNLDQQVVSAAFNVAENTGIYTNVFSGERVSLIQNIVVDLEPGGYLLLQR